jgi:hypothetical protein
MLHHRSIRESTIAGQRNEPERKVEAADALIRDTVEHLTRRCPAHLVGAAAREDLLELKPHLEDALAALAEIEGRRDLTDEELARRRAFKMLLAVRR